MKKMVTLVSGGLDSTLMSVLAREQEFQVFPLFIDYGQLAAAREWESCVRNHEKHSLPKPKKMNLKGFGSLIRSGLTNRKLRIKEDAFLPGRNPLFLLMAGSYAYQNQSNNIAIGLLKDEFALFPDQTREFISRSEEFLKQSLSFEVTIVTPLMEFNKAEVLELAKTKNVKNTYSCHSGGEKPCGRCISCEEFKTAKKALGGR